MFATPVKQFSRFPEKDFRLVDISLGTSVKVKKKKKYFYSTNNTVCHVNNDVK
jgi:hypothetical protein